MSRDPRTDPQPGDVVAGPLVQAEVITITIGKKGIESVRARISLRNEGSRSEARGFELAEWIEFVKDAEVLHVATR